MGKFFKAFKKGIEAAANVTDQKEFKVADKQVVCPHCDNTLFYTGSALLNTTGMTYLKLDWANKSANTLICRNCGNVQWFLNRIDPL